MKINIPYGDRSETLDIPEGRIEQIIWPNAVQSGDAGEILRRAVDHPLNASSLDDFLKGREDILIIVNDATRPTPTARVMEILYPKLKGRRFRILVATGSHRPPMGDEYDFIFGKLYPDLKDHVCVHDAKASECFSLGKTRYGNDLMLNRFVRDADAIIPIGSIEPHYFAGYTGGRKSFMPGVASYDCITANHRLAISRDAQAMVLSGNPVAAELDDAEELLKAFPVFSIQTVLDGHQDVYAAAAGDMGESFRSLLGKTEEGFCRPHPAAGGDCRHRFPGAE